MSTLRLSPAIIHRPNFSSTAAAATTQKMMTTTTTTSSLRLPRLRLTITRRVRRRRTGTVMSGTAASSYATALAQVAKSSDSLEATMADMERVESVFSNASVQSFFANPTISAEKKALVIGEIAESSGLKPHTANFLNVLVDMRRIDILGEIYKEFEIEYNKITGTEVAVVSSVVKLESQHLSQISQVVQRLTGAENIRLKTVIDPSLVAGFTVRYGHSGSKMIDMSVKKQLDEITAQLDFSNITLA